MKFRKQLRIKSSYIHPFILKKKSTGTKAFHKEKEEQWQENRKRASKNQKVDKLLTWAQFRHSGPDHDFLTLKHQSGNIKIYWR